MIDRLKHRFPPLSNSWVQGLASGTPLDQVAADELRTAILAGQRSLAIEQISVVVAGVEAANSNFFRFELETAVSDEEPRLITMGPNETTAEHGLGLTPTQSTRKLVALLVVRKTGVALRFVLDESGKVIEPEVGSLAVFPAYCTVRVEADANSEVEVVAFHAFGPTFR